MILWTRLPEATRLLASCAADPPPIRAFAYRFQEIEHRFVGRRVARLRRLYRAAEPAIDTRAWREWLRWDPQRAIRESVRRGLKARPQRPQRPVIHACVDTATLSTATIG